MQLSSASVITDTADVLAIPGVPRSPKIAQERAEILGRLESVGFVAEDAETMQVCSVGTFHAFKPQNGWYEWLTHRVALHMMRIDRAERIERRLRDLQALRAIDCWELDQVQAAAELGADLASDPQRVVAELWCTAAGCNWMIEKWESLAAVPATEWTAAQLELAQRIDPMPVHFYATPGYAQMRILNLVVKRDRLKASDEALGRLTQSDLSPAPSRLLAEARKYTRWLHRQLRWYVTQLRIEPPKRVENLKYYPTFFTPAAQPEASDDNPRTNPISEIECAPAAEPQTNPFAAGSTPDCDRTNPISDPEALVRHRTKPILSLDHPPDDRTNPILPAR